MKRFLICIVASIALLVFPACSTNIPTAILTLPPTLLPATLTETPTQTPKPVPTLSPTPELEFLTLANVNSLKPGEPSAYLISEISDREFLSIPLVQDNNSNQLICNSKGVFADTKIQSVVTEDRILQSVFTISYSCPNGTYAYTDLISETVSVIDLTQGKEVWSIERGPGVSLISDLYLSPNGKMIYIAQNNGQSYIFDLEANTLISDWKLPVVDDVAWSSDSKKVAIARGTPNGHVITIYDINGESLAEYPVPFEAGGMSSSGQILPVLIKSLSWSSNGDHLAISNTTGEVIVIEVNDLEEKNLRLVRPKYNFESLLFIGVENFSFSPDGTLLAGIEDDVNNDFHLRVWSVQDGSEIYSLTYENEIPPTYTSENLFFNMKPKWSSDGSILAFASYTYADNNINFIDTVSWEKTSFTIVFDPNNKIYDSERFELGFSARDRDFYLAPDDKGFFEISDIYSIVEEGNYKLEITAITPYRLP